MSVTVSGAALFSRMFMLACVALALTGPVACGPKPVEDPVKSLNTVGLDAGVHLEAIQELAKQDPITQESSRLLRRVMTAPGYNRTV
ncbi:MAG: hypothetical protein JNK53_05340, partial [Phycisphaerae bacterium]|nr:hypothetical protein [Phycisphaerae bacterium]